MTANRAQLGLILAQSLTSTALHYLLLSSGIFGPTHVFSHKYTFQLYRRNLSILLFILLLITSCGNPKSSADFIAMVPIFLA